MLDNILVRLAIILPRGGGRFLRLMSKYLPSLKEYPLRLTYADHIVIRADLGNNVFFPLLKYHCYPHQLVEDLIVISFLKSGDTVVDVGANIGYVSAICASCVGPMGKVHAFEPSKVTFGYISQLAQQLSQIHPWNYAVSDECGSTAFLDEVMSDRSHIASIIDEPNTYQVETISLDAWASANKIDKIDFLKVDAEGFDHRVIKGSTLLINKYQPIIEFEIIDDTGSQIADFLSSDCRGGEYVVFRANNVYPIDLISKTGATNNYFAIPRSKMTIVPRFLYDRGYLKPADCNL